MNFLHPQGLWLLLLGLPLVALHFYRGKIRKLSVPALALWEQVVLEEQRKSAFQKLRHRASLLLNLLLLLVLTAAVAEPLVPGWNTPGQKWAFVIDTSPRMMAREEGGRTRLELARAQAEEWLSGVGEVALYDGLGPVESSTTDHDRIRDGLGRIEIRREGNAAAVAQSVQEAQSGVRVLLFTDRGGENAVSICSPVSNRVWVQAQTTRRPA